MSRSMVVAVAGIGGAVAAAVVTWIVLDDPSPPAEATAAPGADLLPTPTVSRPGDEIPPGVRRAGPTDPGTTDDNASPEARRTAVEPMPRRLAGEAHAARASSFQQLLTAYDSVAAETLEEFNARYAGAIAFRTADEFAWMEKQGFPLPEEILAAAGMPLEELRALADGGDRSAQFLYLDRTLQEVRELRQSYLRSGMSPDGLKEIPEYDDALFQAAYAKAFLTESESPFAGYLMAEFSRAAFGNPYGYMAGLLHASNLGDPRAYDKLRTFVRHNEICESALNAMGAYAVIVEGRKTRSERP